MNITDFREKFKDYIPTLQGIRGEFAVLVPLVDGPEGLSLLYEVRSPDLRHHAAEVCFPGGRMEPGESAEQCALRETWEELGIEARHIEVLGRLDFLHLRSEGLMHPVLAHVDAAALDALRPNRDEVADVFLVPLSWLQNHPPKLYTYELKPMVDDDFPYQQVGSAPAYRWKAGRMEVPVYEGLPHPLWGLTGRITMHLIESMQK